MEKILQELSTMKNLTEYDCNDGTFDARLQQPFVMIVYGPSMSGKTQFVLNLIRNERALIAGKPVKKIIWFYGIETDQISKLPSIDSRITQIKGLPTDELIDEYLDPRKNVLLIFDDLMQESVNSRTITDLVTRKCHHRNASIILITQDLFYEGRQRKTFLRNAHYLTIFSNPLDRSGVCAIANKIMPKRTQTFIKMYEHATSMAHGYLFIDGRQSTPTCARFRTDIFPPIQKVYRIL